MAKLKTRFWVDALRWRAERAGAAMYAVKKGDFDHGAVLVKVVNIKRSTQIYTSALSADGDDIWLDALDGKGEIETNADAYICDRIKHDPDLWVLEIEDKHGCSFLTEPISICT